MRHTTSIAPESHTPDSGGSHKRLQRRRAEAIENLIAALTHDLRTPLASIMFGASVLLDSYDKVSPTHLRESLERISDAATQQQNTIAALLDIAALGPPVRVDVLLEGALMRVVDLLRPMLREGKHHVTFKVDPGANCVQGNPLIIEQILANLITCACRSARRATTVQLRGRASPAGRLVMVQLVDDGPGTLEVLEPRVFAPSVASTLGRASLELVTAQQAVADLGGTLEHGRPGGAVRYVLALPRGSCDGPPGGEIRVERT